MQTSKFLLDQLKKKYADKPIEAQTCQWISVDMAEDDAPVINSKEDFADMEKLVKVLEHRANLLLQKSAMTLAGKLGEMKPIEAFNDTQAFLLNDLSKAFAELVIVHKFKEMTLRI